MKVVVGASSFSTASAKKLLEDAGVELVENPFGRRMSEDEIIECLDGADGLLAGLEPLNETVFTACPRLKAIARIGIGMDNVDIAGAQARGIKISNTPDAPASAVAEMALSALLCILHQIIPSNVDMHARVWKKRMGKSITEISALLVGYGRTGSRFAAYLAALGANVYVFDPYIKKDIPFARAESFEEALRMADVVSFHVPGNDELLNAERIALLKQGTIVLNASRGGVVNEQAMFEALKRGGVSCYWADVFPAEPYKGCLCDCENTVITPHISTYTICCRKTMEMQAVKNLMRDLGVTCKEI